MENQDVFLIKKEIIKISRSNLFTFFPSKIKHTIMIRLKGLLELITITLITLTFGCSKNENSLENITTSGKTSLFEEVTEPESNGEDGMALSTTAESFSDASTISTSDRGESTSNGQIEPGVLTAGEWNDLNNWDFWNNLLSNQEYYEDVNKWHLKEIKRYSFLVTGNNKSWVANAEISLMANEVEVWKTKTDNKGKATLWSDLELDGLTARIKFEETEKVIIAIKEHAEGINKVSINKTTNNENIIDIYFAVDATGSMGDEINYLKVELNNVIKQIKQNNPLLDMRFGSVFYRDEGDNYVTRPFNFTTNEASLISFISDQSANGGGDFPEAVHSALDIAITQNSWNDNASARILFLLLDAPPHYTQEAISSLELNLINAAEKGIKIIPITASGIDKATEYLMRSFAILTNGTYVFITDDSGVGNAHLQPTIGAFEVEKLNDLMVRLVGEYVD